MNFRKKLKDVKALVFDVDGVFSREFITKDNGEFQRIMNAKDGLALKYAGKKGLKIAIITGGTNVSVKDRFETLGIKDVYLGTSQKIDALENFSKKYKISKEHILYMGDDLPDFEVMKAIGFAACPADSADEIQEISDYISEKKGGEGCVRDIIEQVMKIQKLWDINDFIKNN